MGGEFGAVSGGLSLVIRSPYQEGVDDDLGRGHRNAENYFVLPFNPSLLGRARELRKSGNLSEVLLWNSLKNKQFKGYDFDRQKIIGNYIVDFFCTNRNVVLEIDGSSHDDKEEYDAERDAYLTGLGLVVIHINANAVLHDFDAVMDMLKNHSSLL